MDGTRYLLAIDQGTTSTRAIVFDEQANRCGESQLPIEQHYPQPGWVDHDPMEIWESAVKTVQAAVDASGIGVSDIAGIGIANQRETTIVWNRSDGRPLAPAIVWQSRQSAPWIDALIKQGKAEAFQRVTGLYPDAYFSASKLAMLLDNDRELRMRAEAGEALFGTVDTWLLWNLTDGRVHATDVTNASRTMLFDLESVSWSDELLSEFGIPQAMLPDVIESSGQLAASGPAMLGQPLPIAGIAGDQHAALFGQACFGVGTAKNTYGTGSFLLMQTGRTPKRSDHKLLTTIAWGIDGSVSYALEGAIFVTGSAVQWLRDGLGLIEHSSDVEALARSVPDAGGVVFVPALTGLGAPHWDATARGGILGITRGTKPGHIARATLESIAFQTRDVLEAMMADSGLPLSELRVDGGAARNDLLLQIQADVLGVPVVRPRELETTALGAAYLAGLGTGVWSGEKEIEGQWHADKRFEPVADRSQNDRAYGRWQDAVSRTLKWE
jgi:glycerol kinase